MKLLRVLMITAVIAGSLQATQAAPLVTRPVDLLQTQPKPPPPPPNPLDLFRKKKKKDTTAKVTPTDTVASTIKDSTKKKKKFSFPKIKLPPRPGETPPTPPGGN